MMIRQAGEPDLPKLIELLQEMDAEDRLETEEYRAIWNKINQYPYYKTFVIEEQDMIIGTCSLIIIDNLGHRGAKLAIAENMIIRQECRGKGIGRQMMQYVIARTQEEECYKLMLSSNKKRTLAHRFYEQLGFEQHGISFKIDLS
jgi:N-acetylglutamate synthase and related acetyltransferases